MVRGTYMVRDTMGDELVVQTYEDTTAVYVEMYDGHAETVNLLAEMKLTPSTAREFAKKLMMAADKADTR